MMNSHAVLTAYMAAKHKESAFIGALTKSVKMTTAERLALLDFQDACVELFRAMDADREPQVAAVAKEAV